MLKAGKIEAAVLPEPFVSLILNEKKGYILDAYKELWEKHTGRNKGYPQVIMLVKKSGGMVMGQ